MSTEKNKEFARKLVKAINEHNIKSTKNFLASNFIEHTFQIKGPENYVKFLKTLFQGFPDFNVSIVDLISEKDKVCARGKFLGTHAGTYYDPSIDRDLAPTGRKISIPFCITFRVIDNKAVESWTVENLLDFCK